MERKFCHQILGGGKDTLSCPPLQYMMLEIIQYGAPLHGSNGHTLASSTLEFPKLNTALRNAIRTAASFCFIALKAYAAPSMYTPRTSKDLAQKRINILRTGKYPVRGNAYNFLLLVQQQDHPQTCVQFQWADTCIMLMGRHVHSAYGGVDVCSAYRQTCK